MKIKTKKQLNLPQLIEYAWENGIKGETFYARETGMENVHFNTSGRAEFSSVHQFSSDDYFTVEVADEITEDTEFQNIVEVTTDDLFATWEDASISTWKSEYSKEFHAYIDGEFKCIWRDGKLVE
ncbi:hypothetical protein [Staphylococcus gallinarum]|uniref:Phage protein n=1 Tax=Staphylococcus gallinarum TaxID=1293 RepID=A0A380FL49_STAGA|nr:hypothetical protein [Staphylococcus gallinarum]GEQ06987.1 hypothetical protein SGA02_28150 [Staphylococcus gallinarum]SUM34056.1 phage protein [Staphylococcus gallinarum]